MYGGVVSFGDYTFPSTLGEFSTNFSNAVPKTIRLPGLSGGYNLDADKAADREVGRVTVGFMLQASSRSGMDDLRDAVNAMYEYGLAKLVYQPTDSTDSVRYCWARVNFISMNQRKDNHTDLWQDVRVIFQVPDPVWLVDTFGGWVLGDGSLLGDVGLVIGGGGYSIAASGTSTTDTITQNGNVTRIARVVITPGAGQSCENPRIIRTEGGVVVDDVQWTGVLSAGESFVIDGVRQTITINGATDWANIEYDHPDFFRLMPGSNPVEVRFANIGDAASVQVFYDEGYL